MSERLTVYDDDRIHRKCEIEQDTRLERFLAQFQQHCDDAILCVINHETIHYYRYRREIPKNLEFEYQQRNPWCTEYYLRDPNTGNVHCIFGEAALRLVCPEFNSRLPLDNGSKRNDPEVSLGVNPSEGEMPSIDDYEITIVHGSEEQTFRARSHPVKLSVVSFK